MATLAELSRTLPEPRSDKLAKYLQVWQYMQMIADDKLPIHATLGQRHVLNDAALERLQAIIHLSAGDEPRRASQLIEQKATLQETAKQKATELYGALQLKPTLFGFGVDLKEVFKMFKRTRK